MARQNVWSWPPSGWSGGQECSLDELEQACADSELFDPTWYLEQNPELKTARVDPLPHYLRWGADKGLDPNPLFDARWYLERNPDVATTGMNPLLHYHLVGVAKGLDPNPLFDTDWYLERNPDVATAGMNPLAHYLRWGEGRDPNPLFDAGWYRERNPDVAAAGINLLVDYVRRGAAEGRDPSPLFDTAWYLERNPDAAASGMNPLAHYLQCGDDRSTIPLFDAGWYLKHNPDVAAAGMNPLVHYLRWGAAEGLDPGPLFDADWYLEQNPDVLAAGINPLVHYVRWGAGEGRIRRARPPKTTAMAGVPRVSAVIPCYNGARWLAETLQSIRVQTAPVHEIIVIDDASSDESCDIARQYGAVVLQNGSNRGEGYSRNVGLRHASGEFIAWLDVDDMWMPHHVATLVRLLQTYPQATAAFGAVQRFGLRDELIRGYVPLGEPSNVFWLAFRDWLHTTIGSMTRRDALLQIGGFDEQERYSVDFDLWLRLSRSHLFVCTHEVTSLWRWHDAQQSTHFFEQVRALYRYRLRYWKRERAVGDWGFAATMERCMIDLWRQEMGEARIKRDLDQVALLHELAPLVPGLRGDQGATGGPPERNQQDPAAKPEFPPAMRRAEPQDGPVPSRLPLS